LYEAEYIGEAKIRILLFDCTARIAVAVTTRSVV
jgi:hypothetical protein